MDGLTSSSSATRRGNPRAWWSLACGLLSLAAIPIGIVLARELEQVTLVDSSGSVLAGALLGWIAGDISTTDPAVAGWVKDNAAYLRWVAPAVGAILVVATGKLIAARKEAVAPDAVDLARASAAVGEVPSVKAQPKGGE